MQRASIVLEERAMHGTQTFDLRGVRAVMPIARAERNMYGGVDYMLSTVGFQVVAFVMVGIPKN